ncbi:RDD family protein [Actinomadura fulvescens]|uniref:RDD domain-containing protein n=1 Tax=Actinomadura fulvescens TaxID=46160 RepID=A0ABP6CQT2_9ACTN
MHSPPPPPFPMPGNVPPPVPTAVTGSASASASAPRGRRLLAWSVDTAALVVVAVLLGSMTWGRLQAYVAEDLPSKAWSAGATLLLSGGNVEKAATEFGAGVWGTFVGNIEQALLLLVLAELLHQAVGLALGGRTIGKAVMDLRVRHADREDAKPGVSRSVRRALATTASGTGLYALAWILLLEGLYFFAVLLWLVAVAAFLANSVPALVGSQRRTFADLAAGTVVVPAHSYERAVAAARQGAVRAWDGAQNAGQIARENAARGAQAERVQQALESDRARRLQELGRRAGRQSADKVREAASSERVQQVQDAGRRLGGRIKGAYQDRRASKPPEPLQTTGPLPALPPPQPTYGQPEWQGNAPYDQVPYAQQPNQQPPYAQQQPYEPPPAQQQPYEPPPSHQQPYVPPPESPSQPS